MVAVEWDKVGSRTFQSGIDRGVLYLQGGVVVPWNGLTGVDEATGVTTQPQYMDGVKYLDRQTPGDYQAKLKAFTYPEEFDAAMGIAADKEGMSVHDQQPQSFGLSYRTLIGNDVDGQQAGYKLHILYNVTAISDGFSVATLSDKVGATDFTWTLNARPIMFPNRRPTAHLSFSTTKMDPGAIKLIEDVLYGTVSTSPRMPLPSEVLAILEGAYSVVNNGDGTFTITGSDSRVQMLDATTAQINNINTTAVDADSFTIEEEV